MIAHVGQTADGMGSVAPFLSREVAADHRTGLSPAVARCPC
jgi:hypothetical protein